ncbi:MAG: trypsin-like serine protease [Candidatus Kariarchaeaceae archaeon]|jgi:hypothetical protein
MKLKYKSLVLLVSFTLILGMIVPGNAITDGELDNGRHPFVGIMVADMADGSPLWRCSGTLISPTVFLTAGHCTEYPTARATIWFEDDLHAEPDMYGYPFEGPTAVEGTTYTHPLYYDYAWFTHDLGVVVLDEPLYMDEYGELPELWQLNELNSGRGHNAWFTAVGYGLQESGPLPSGRDVSMKTRMVSYPELLQINTPGMTGDFSMILTNNPTTGGTCFGDSGGPNFIEDSNVVAAVTSFGMNDNCAGFGGVYRVDGYDDLTWLANFDI